MSPFRLRRILLTSLGTLAVVAGLSYGGFEARRLLAGPQIEISSPRDGSATSSPRIVLAGTAHNISFLTVNGQQAYTDQSGHFALALSPTPGYAVFEVKAVDRFGRETQQQVHITMVNFCPLKTYG